MNVFWTNMADVNCLKVFTTSRIQCHFNDFFTVRIVFWNFLKEDCARNNHIHLTLLLKIDSKYFNLMGNLMMGTIGVKVELKFSAEFDFSSFNAFTSMRKKKNQFIKMSITTENLLAIFRTLKIKVKNISLSFFIQFKCNIVKMCSGFCLASVFTVNYSFHCVYSNCKKKQLQQQHRIFLWMKMTRKTVEGYCRRALNIKDAVLFTSLCVFSSFFRLRYVWHRYALMPLFVLCQLPIILTLQWNSFVFAFFASFSHSLCVPQIRKQILCTCSLFFLRPSIHMHLPVVRFYTMRAAHSENEFTHME